MGDSLSACQRLKAGAKFILGAQALSVKCVASGRRLTHLGIVKIGETIFP